MIEYTDTDNLYAQIASRFRNDLDFRAAKYQSVAKVLPSGRPVVATVKVDGELVAFAVDRQAGHAALYNARGRVRHDTAITHELLRLVGQAGKNTVVGFGELYAVDKAGTPLPFNIVNGILRTKASNLKAEDEAKLRLAVFDLFEIDRETLWGRMIYADRFTLLWTLFEAGRVVHPVAGDTEVREADPIEQMWKKHVLDDSYEGLVLRVNGAIKVKPVHTVDLAVIGYTMGSGRHEGRMGALITAFRNPEGRFLYAGKVGTGFTDDDRDEWMERACFWRMKQGYQGPRIKGVRERIHWLSPGIVAEVRAMQFNWKNVPTFIWLGGSTKDWQTMPAEKPGAIMRHPRFVGWREDKMPTEHEVRISQVPGWEKPRSVPAPSGNGEQFGNMLADMEDDLRRIAQFKLNIPPRFLDELISETNAKAYSAYQRGIIKRQTGRKMLNVITEVMRNVYRDWGRKAKVREAFMERVRERGKKRLEQYRAGQE